MNAKHTDGPWYYGEFDLYGGYDCMSAGITAGPALIDSATYKRFTVGGCDDETKEQMIADARLIAAAPELLEAIQMLVDGRTAGLASREAWDYARLAIAKATGAKP